MEHYLKLYFLINYCYSGTKMGFYYRFLLIIDSAEYSLYNRYILIPVPID